MLKKLIIILGLIFITGNLVFCQGFNFTWKITPSFSETYIVKITRNDSKDDIKIISMSWSNESVYSKLDKEDCDSIYNFMKVFSYRVKGSNFELPPERKYLNIESTEDEKMILIDGKKVRKETLQDTWCLFDSSLNKYYTETTPWISVTDGTTYSGEFMTSEGTKVYSVHCVRINEQEYKLNLMMFRLISKYLLTENVIQREKLIKLEKLIVENKPGKYSNI